MLSAPVDASTPFLMASCILFSCSRHSYLLCSGVITGFSDAWLLMPEVVSNLLPNGREKSRGHSFNIVMN